MKKQLLQILLIACVGLFGLQQSFGQLTAGDIAFTAFNADGDDDFAFVALKDIPANTSIWFTDNEWTGTSFNNTNEGELEWSHTSIVTAGTVIIIEGAVPSTTIGTITGSGFNLGASNEDILALLAEPSSSTMTTPGFLAGISNDLNGSGATLAGTGLTLGVNFIDFSDDNDGFEYTGSRSGQTNFSDYLPFLISTSNWQIESSNGDNIIPISTTSFSIVTGPPQPTLAVLPIALTDLDYFEGFGPSAAKSFEVTGSNLDGSDVVVSLPLVSDFEIAETVGGMYGTTITLTTYDGTARDVFVRLKSGLLIGNFSDDVSVSGGDASTITISVSGEITAPSYCDAGPTSDSDSEIENVTLIGENFSINNDTTNECTGETGGFVNDFTAQSADLEQDGSYTLDVEFGDCNDASQFDGAGGVWIDWNSDFDFEDANEEIGTANVAVSSGNVTESFTINVPSGQAIGTYRMRIVQEEDGNDTSISPCNTFSWGSVEDYTIEVIAPNTNDTDSQVSEPATISLTQVPADVVIAANVTLSATSFPVLGFVIQDLASGDGLPTNVTRMRLVPGDSNTADWTDHIQGVRIADQTFAELSPTSVSISDTEIVLEFNTPINVGDGGDLGIGVGVYLNDNDMIVDGSVLQFKVDAASSGFIATNTGSGFADPFAADVVGNNQTINVVATQLDYLVQASDVFVDEAMSPDVQIAARDSNGNVDLDYVENVDLSSDGTLTGSPISEVAVSGVVTFTNLVHTVIASGRTLTVTDGSLSSDSELFDVLVAPIFPGAGDLIITEVSDADDFNNEFIEIYNTTSDIIDMSTSKLQMLNDGTVYDFDDSDIPSAIIPANGFLIVTRGGTQSNFETAFGALNPNTAFVQGSSGMFFGTSAKRRWRLFEGGTTNTADGTLIDDTNSTVAGENDRDFFNFLTDAFETTSDTEANPGVIDNLVYVTGAWKYNAKADVTTGFSNVYFQDSFTATEEVQMNDGEILPDFVLDLDGNNLSINGTFTFKSDAGSTAQLADATSATVTGEVTVERFIPAKRAFRFLSSAVSGVSIANSWQQEIHITGVDGSTNGFDPTTTNNASMFTFNTVNQAWDEISNTATNLDAGTAYRVLVRGDRATVDLTDNQSPSSDVTLSATGSLATGSLITGTNLPQLSQDASTTDPEVTKFSFVGNPYQAVIDARELTYSGGVRSDFIVFWDPNLGVRGAFVQVELSTGNTILPTPAPTPSSTEANQFIMPGQAFFVGNDTSVTQPSITFSEDAKATTQSQTEVFSTSGLAYLNLRLYTQSAWSNNQPEQDALGIRWAAEYTTEASNEDIGKFNNPDENIAVNNTNALLGIDKRNFPENEEIISLFVNSYEHQDYVIYNQFANLPENSQLYLEDHYLETSTLLSNDEVYNFSVDTSIAESMANDRFSIRFDVETLSQTEFTENMFSIYPNPVDELLNLSISTDLAIDSGSVEVYDVLGRKMIQREVSFANGNTQQIDVSELNAGIYIVQMSFNSKTYSSRIIKM